MAPMRHKDLIDLLGRLRGTGAWERIAEDTSPDHNGKKVSVMTISRIYRNVIENPGILTCERIADAAKKYERHLLRERRHVNG